jgi:hypothetical protein
MDPEVVTLRPNSWSDRAALTAPLDLGIENTRIIGGHMVAIHVARRGLDRSHVRTTADTDFGLDVGELLRLGLVERLANRNGVDSANAVTRTTALVTAIVGRG